MVFRKVGWLSSMAYLGIREVDNTTDNGLYYFDVLSIRNEMAKHFTNPVMYVDREKEKALEEFGLKEEDIKDGIVLIRKYRYGQKEESRCYLGVRGTPFDGVYEFEHMSARDKIAKKLENTYKSTDLEAILKEFNIDKSELKDGGYLFGKEANEYIKAHKPAPITNAPVKTSEENSEVKKEVKSNSNLLRNMINVISPDKDVIEILMNEGTVYRITYRNLFYLREGIPLTNCATLGADNEVVIDGAKIDKLIENGDIIRVAPSRIVYHDGYAVAYDCDDLGSPTVRVEEDGRYDISHYYDKVVINVSAVSSVIGADTYRELAINFKKMTSDKHKYVYDYLVKKYKSEK